MTYSSLEYSASLTRQVEGYGIYVTCWKRTPVLHFLNLIVRFLDPKHIFSSLLGSEYSGQHNKGVFSHCSILNDYVPTRYHFLDAASSLEKLFSTWRQKERVNSWKRWKSLKIKMVVLRRYRWASRGQQEKCVSELQVQHRRGNWRTRKGLRSEWNRIILNISLSISFDLV